ncbi:MAG: hypothetical protein LR005_02390 [Candidatus Pacebacteria bacterium]|nr:hypothetical protein [Candidatus Paceibacterota bacterium]
MESILKALNKTSQMMQKLAQAGLTEELKNNIINSPENKMAETMITSISGNIKNKLLTQIHTDKTAIVRKMYGADACFKDLFRSLCGHTKQKNLNSIPALVEKLKENNLLFSSRKLGVDYIKAGVKSGIHEKGFSYLFAYLNKYGNVFAANVYFVSGDLVIFVFQLSDTYKWRASRAHRIVVPATKLKSKS